jgi:hypothetical protein
MPVTTGLVQRIFVDSGDAGAVQACVFIGPTLANVELLLLRREAAEAPPVADIKSVMLDTLIQALTARREVVVEHAHPNPGSGIYSVLVR